MNLRQTNMSQDQNAVNRKEKQVCCSLSKLKTSVHQDTNKKMSEQVRECEKIFINYLSEKGLVSRIYKELSELRNKKPKKQKIDKRLEKTLHKGRNTKNINTLKNVQHHFSPGKC